MKRGRLCERVVGQARQKRERRSVCMCGRIGRVERSECVVIGQKRERRKVCVIIGHARQKKKERKKVIVG